MRGMFISYAQLGAVHQAAGDIEIRARRLRQSLSGGLYVGSVKSIALAATDEPGDDIVAVITRYEAPSITRRYSYFGNPVWIDAPHRFDI